MTPRGVVGVIVGVLVGLTVVLLWGPRTIAPLLLLGVALLVLRTEVRRTPRPAGRLLVTPSAVLLVPHGPSGRPLTGWTDAELCRAWRVSHAQLQQHQGAAWAEHLSGLRRTYLDELERRDPAGFAAWIASGARAAGNPGRYLSTARRTP